MEKTHPEALPGIWNRSPYPTEVKILNAVTKVTVSKDTDELLIKELDKYIDSAPQVINK